MTLEISHLTTLVPQHAGPAPVVDDISFVIEGGETLGLVGESGSGKSLTALSILRLVPAPGRIAGGSIRLRGRELLELSEREMRQVRGADIGLVFQEPLTALNPVLTVGDQVAETLTVHRRASRQQARHRAIELLEMVGLPEAAACARDFPHQLSGGMRQRVMIAMAIACRPVLLIADEPTTALDVTVQAQILDLLRDMTKRLNMSLLLISHDLGVIAEAVDRVAVMYAGRIVEQGPVRTVFTEPKHPYTRGLLASLPSGSSRRLQPIQGVVPSPGSWPSGCRFHTRCPDCFEPCVAVAPPDVTAGPDHRVQCHLVHDAAR